MRVIAALFELLVSDLIFSRMSSAFLRFRWADLAEDKVFTEAEKFRDLYGYFMNGVDLGVAELAAFAVFALRNLDESVDSVRIMARGCMPLVTQVQEEAMPLVILTLAFPTPIL